MTSEFDIKELESDLEDWKNQAYIQADRNKELEKLLIDERAHSLAISDQKGWLWESYRLLARDQLTREGKLSEA